MTLNLIRFPLAVFRTLGTNGQNMLRMLDIISSGVFNALTSFGWMKKLKISIIIATFANLKVYEILYCRKIWIRKFNFEIVMNQ